MNTVKIVSGKYRGRSLTAPGGGTHPMGAREKLALFNMIAPYLDGAMVLDAYAGSGALGIEALSRNAKRVVFIEKNKVAAQSIRKNLASLSLDGEIFTGAVKNYESQEGFDIILADPPYDNYDMDEVVSLVQYLKAGGIFVLSHPGEQIEIAGLETLKSNKYAAAHITIYIKH
ncbi:MAG: 16S rRNA (guanine(966)-N(2))-methyltransferase RsmD [Alphaproteobacteria bacterium]|nr:16S rRNA (guanine(966)-N(2))-methyltransferase RsmD [Alphaproteobacteria bacterium]